MQFLILAYDGDDEGAAERRLAMRPEHVALVDKMKKKGRFLYGGAMLNDKEQMIGSMMVVDFASKEALQGWLKEEPYVVGDVWKRLEVHPFRVAAAFL